MNNFLESKTLFVLLSIILFLYYNMKFIYTFFISNQNMSVSPCKQRASEIIKSSWCPGIAFIFLHSLNTKKSISVLVLSSNLSISHELTKYCMSAIILSLFCAVVCRQRFNVSTWFTFPIVFPLYMSLYRGFNFTMSKIACAVPRFLSNTFVPIYQSSSRWSIMSISSYQSTRP